MKKYQVVRAWHGVTVGQIVEIKDLHPSLKPNVRLVGAAVEGELDPKAIADAKKEAKTIVADATKEAERIVAEAQAEAESLAKEAQGKLTPATPNATSDKPKAAKPK